MQPSSLKDVGDDKMLSNCIEDIAASLSKESAWILVQKLGTANGITIA
jgi:hypothetical protein